MKKLVSAALVFALMIALAAPAMAYRYMFYTIDTTKEIELQKLLENWQKAVEEGSDAYEMDVGDLGMHEDSNQGGTTPLVKSPTVEGGQPLRSYIMGPDQILRTFNMLVSNETEDILPPEAIDKLAGKPLSEAVVGFAAFEALMQPGAIAQADLDAFAAKYQTQIAAIYEAFTAYMTGAGFEGKYEASVEGLTAALYIAVNHLYIGEKLTACLEDVENPGLCEFIGTEIYKGFLAAFLDDEASMREFATILYVWMKGGEDETFQVTGAPYAYVSYDAAAGTWQLVDIFQLVIEGDMVKSKEIWDIVIDAQYFIDVAENTPVIALYYDTIDGQWKIAGLNAPAFEAIIANIG